MPWNPEQNTYDLIIYKYGKPGQETFRVAQLIRVRTPEGKSYIQPMGNLPVHKLASLTLNSVEIVDPPVRNRTQGGELALTHNSPDWNFYES